MPAGLLSNPQVEDSLYDSESMRRYARIALGEDLVLDETTIVRLRYLHGQHHLNWAMFEQINELLPAKRLGLKVGTIVDATVVAAPSSTKNATATRDPEMKQGHTGKTFRWEAFEACRVQGRVNRRAARPRA